MSELRKDLEAVEERMVREGWPSASRRAELLAELGYLKVVRCRECKLQKHCDMLICNTAVGFPNWIDYCSAGERVVAKNATTETSVPAPEKAE